MGATMGRGGHTSSAPPELRRIAGLLLVTGTVVVTVTLVLLGGVRVTDPFLAVAFAVGFLLAERHTVHFEVGTETLEVSAADLLLTVGFFVVGPSDLLLARIAGGVARPPHLARAQTVLVTGLHLLRAGSVVYVAYSLGMPMLEDPASWSLALAAIGLGSLVDMVVLAAVLRALSDERAGLGAELTVARVAWGQLSAIVAIATLLLSTIRTSALLFAVVPALAVLAGYRRLYRERHEVTRMRTLYELSTRVTGGSEFDEVVASVIADARDLLGCAEVALLVRGAAGGGRDLVLRVGASGEPETGPEADGPSLLPLAWTSVAAAGSGFVEADEVVVPVVADDELIGAMRATGRPLGRAAFTPGDRSALRSLADRVAEVVRRDRLTSELRTATATTAYLETHDVLTGLGNRRWFVAELERLVADHERVVVALSNLRGFRRVNEVHGQAAGDAALVQVAATLRAGLPGSARLARLSGDEFAVAVPAHEVDVLRAVLQTPVTVQLGHRELGLGIAAGMAESPRDGTTPTALLRAADLAMAIARRGASAVVRYQPSLEETVARRGRLASDLPVAISAGAVSLVYQPVHDLRTGTVVGAEALARWDHPELGPIPPSEFVCVAEETAQVQLLTRHVLSAAVAQAAAWRRSGHDLEVAVNVSAHDLDRRGLVREVDAVLALHDLPADRLVLEVTETAMMRDLARADAVLRDLAALGVGLAIDDFGTGHSSLAHLHDLPVTGVKLDRTFVADLLVNQQSELIVRTVLELAAARGLVVVAEGIEDAAVRARLVELGADRGQGMHLGSPVGAAELLADLAGAS